MKIKERLRLNTWISLGAIVLMMLTLAWSFREVYRADRNMLLADEMWRATLERAFLRDDYLLNPGERAKVQWYAKSETLRALLESAPEKFTSTEDRALLREAQKNFDTTFFSFSAILEKHKQNGHTDRNKPAFSEAESILISQVLLSAHVLNDNISRLHESSHRAVKRAQNRGVIFVILFIVSGVIAIVINSIFTGRIVAKHVLTLHEGVEIIGAGNLDYRIDVAGDSELSDLARASNKMVAKLKASYTSVENLQQEITERRQAEKQIRRQSVLLASINRVFYETLTAASEKEVAQTCLAVAQELTSSKFGFIGEITPEGLFTTTALSNPGWDVCRMSETQATMLIRDMAIRGIWGQVILTEHSLIVNDPASHPDRVGIPEGHPSLTSFLGVPLKDQNKVIGMIAMANCEEGYTADQQHDLEALSIAFVEAIYRKQAEEKIRKLNEELEKRVLERTTLLEAANKELEAFSYSVSHDLRAPLRGIDGFSHALLEDYQDILDDTAKSYLDRVRKATQHMGRLIDDMLKLSRVTRSEFRHEAVNLSTMVRAISEKLQQDNPDRIVDAIIREGVFVNGDPYLLQVALENLIDNAWKFTSKEARPQCEFGTTVREGKTVCFIRDNGAGFDMTYVDKLFGAFQRLHTSDEFPGTGIGLATVRRIINRHGGEVWAEAEVGKGATFYFTIA